MKEEDKKENNDKTNESAQGDSTPGQQPNPYNEGVPNEQASAKPESPEAPGKIEPLEAMVQPTSSPYSGGDTLDVTPIRKATDAIKDEISKVVIDQDEVIELMITALITGGHCLLEGLPGIAKTLTAKMLARTIDSDFSRIQFTPDLMPTDVTGTSVFNVKNSEFYFKEGPIFSNVILIDEINRAPAKTQAALMEVMEEKQLTYDGTTHIMEFPFFVIATQNPVEQEGTYSLPEAQLDRFIFRIVMEYPNLNTEKEILYEFQSDFNMRKKDVVKPVVTPQDLKRYSELIEKVFIKKELIDYIAHIVHNTRNNGDLFLGASPRASLAIMKTAKAKAAIKGRAFVIPDDIQEVCYPVLNHRIILSHEREMEGTTVKDVVRDILEKIDVPR
jgi:MoxR-like ATPase